MQRAQIIHDSRLAGEVYRYHTWPHLRRQSIGEHSWQLLRIWSLIWGPPPVDITSYIIWHDAGEIAIGDNPFPVKQNNPELKKMLDFMEEEALKKMGAPTVELIPADKIRVKICDLLDMHEFGLNEEQLGNKYAHPIVVDTLRTVYKLMDKLPEKENQLIYQYLEMRRGQLENHRG